MTMPGSGQSWPQALNFQPSVLCSEHPLFLQQLKKMSVTNAVRLKKPVILEIYLEMWLKSMVCWTSVSCLLKMNDFTKN